MTRFRVYKRQEPLGWGSCLVFLGAVAVSLLVSGLLLSIQGKPAFRGILLLIQSAYFSSWAVEDCLIKAVPIFLCSLGVSIAFRLQIWNIGAEGQYAMGAIGATWMALKFGHLPGLILLPRMFMAAAISGRRLGVHTGPVQSPAACQRNYRHFDAQLYRYSFSGLPGLWPVEGSGQFRVPHDQGVSPAAVVGAIGTTRLNWGLLVCIVMGVAFWIFFKYTRLGFELRASGENPRAARYATYPIQRPGSSGHVAQRDAGRMGRPPGSIRQPQPSSARASWQGMDTPPSWWPGSLNSILW